MHNDRRLVRDLALAHADSGSRALNLETPLSSEVQLGQLQHLHAARSARYAAKDVRAHELNGERRLLAASDGNRRGLHKRIGQDQVVEGEPGAGHLGLERHRRAVVRSRKDVVRGREQMHQSLFVAPERCSRRVPPPQTRRIAPVDVHSGRREVDGCRLPAFYNGDQAVGRNAVCRLEAVVAVREVKIDFPVFVGVQAVPVVAPQSVDVDDLDMRMARKAADGHFVCILVCGGGGRNGVHDIPLYRSARHYHVRQDLPRGHSAADVLEHPVALGIKRALVRILQFKAVGSYLHPCRLDANRHAALGIRAGDQVFSRAAQGQRLRRPVVGPALAAAFADIDAVDGNSHRERRGRRRAAHGCMVSVAPDGEVVLAVRKIQVRHTIDVRNSRAARERRIDPRHGKALPCRQRLNLHAPASLSVYMTAVWSLVVVGDVVDRVARRAELERHAAAGRVRALDLYGADGVRVFTPKAHRAVVVRHDIGFGVLRPQIVVNPNRVARTKPTDHSEHETHVVGVHGSWIRIGIRDHSSLRTDAARPVDDDGLAHRRVDRVAKPSHEVAESTRATRGQHRPARHAERAVRKRHASSRPAADSAGAFPANGVHIAACDEYRGDSAAITASDAGAASDLLVVAAALRVDIAPVDPDRTGVQVVSARADARAPDAAVRRESALAVYRKRRSLRHFNRRSPPRAVVICILRVRVAEARNHVFRHKRQRVLHGRDGERPFAPADNSDADELETRPQNRRSGFL